MYDRSYGGKFDFVLVFIDILQDITFGRLRCGSVFNLPRLMSAFVEALIDRIEYTQCF